MTISQPISQVERAVSAPPLHDAGRWPGRRPANDGLMGVALLAGPANVIMELARPGVGYGVLESRVESGRADRHPIKRARTTFTYLAVARRGTDAQKKAYSRAVSGSHAQVYSTPDSPVEYNAFDKDLQLWVAACLYKGGVDVYRIFIGEMDDETADKFYWEARTLATTCRCRSTCGPPTAGPSTATGRSRWRRCTSTTRFGSTCTPSRCPASAVSGCRAASAGRRGIQPADHQRVPAAEIPR